MISNTEEIESKFKKYGKMWRKADHAYFGRVQNSPVPSVPKATQASHGDPSIRPEVKGQIADKQIDPP